MVIRMSSKIQDWRTLSWFIVENKCATYQMIFELELGVVLLLLL
jgi:hypothetical protein